ncbi:hypothetical protein NIES4071_01960 [Calothrix sp. NIES-4071]|nr:hypothetical protein NIES4071_01960 [Calothrix sp. NIES-4071]BAZ54542.1 hypothetical protein NIES4105_01950 [Calothrix sp. NIES-4105]
MFINQFAVLFSNFILLASVSTLFLICLFFLIECIAALFSNPDFDQQVKANWQDIKVTVLVPAHNEELVIGSTLERLAPMLKKQDSLIVIADNCTDATAKEARVKGATVIERQDLVHKGKGYALDYGLQFIAASPPDVVIVIDADCTVHNGAIQKLSQRAVSTGCPVQATYLMARPKNSNSSKDFISQFSNIVRNLVRPLGLTYLQIPSSLHGTGMAFPWSTTQKVSLANGHLLEDLKLGLDLTLAGHKPIFCQEAKVTGYFPSSTQAAKTQKTRWEHGHLQLIQTYVPILIKEAGCQKRLDMLGSVLDLCVPPLSLLVVIWLSVTIASLVFGVLTTLWVPVIIATSAGICFLTAIFIAWAKFASTELPLSQLLSIPLYILWKIPVYLKFVIKPQSTWVRTERD